MDLLRLPMYMRSPVWTETDDASNNIYLCVMLVLFVVGGGCVWQAQLNCPLEKLRIIFRSIKDGIYWFDRLVIIRGPWNAAPNEEEAKEFHTIGRRTINWSIAMDTLSSRVPLILSASFSSNNGGSPPSQQQQQFYSISSCFVCPCVHTTCRAVASPFLVSHRRVLLIFFFFFFFF